MQIGAHLPLIPISAGEPSLAGLLAYASAASRLGYRWLCANDHLVFRRPWLDGLTELAAVLDTSDDLGLATTVCLPAVRGPAQAAKAFAALDVLSGGRFVAGVGPGSSERDYVVGGVPAHERFARFEEAVRALRALLGRDPEPFAGRFSATAGVTLEPPPGEPGRPPSGSQAGAAAHCHRWWMTAASPALNPLSRRGTSTNSGCRGWGSHEPQLTVSPDADPHVRWCGRAVGEILSPTPYPDVFARS